MSDLLEDPDGAPYPERVQKFVREWSPWNDGVRDVADFRAELVDALESVSRFVHPDD